MVHWHSSQSIKPTAYLEGNHWEVICHFFFGIWKSAGGRSCYLERNEILLTCRLMPSFLFQPQELLDPGYLIILGREKKKRWGKKKKKKETTFSTIFKRQMVFLSCIICHWSNVPPLLAALSMPAMTYRLVWTLAGGLLLSDQIMWVI